SNTEVLRKDVIRKLVAGYDGSLWMVADTELVQYKPGVFTNVSSKYGIKSVVTSIYAARDGSLWVGTTNGILFFKDGVMISRQLEGEVINSIAGLGDLNFWVVARKGRVFRFRNGEFEQFTTKHSLPGDQIRFAYAGR